MLCPWASARFFELGNLEMIFMDEAGAALFDDVDATDDSEEVDDVEVMGAATAVEDELLGK